MADQHSELFLNFDQTTQRDREAQFLLACETGNMQFVRYLLAGPVQEHHIDISCYKNEGICRACSHGELEVVKYLLTSPNLKKHADIHMPQDRAFKTACLFDRPEVLEYLITEYKIEKTPEIDEFFASRAGADKYAQSLFLARELDQGLTVNNGKHRTKKI